MDYSNKKNGSIDDGIINNNSSNNKDISSSEKDIIKTKQTKAKFVKRIFISAITTIAPTILIRIFMDFEVSFR